MTKTWTEHSGTSLLTYTQTSCPDADCQKIVDGTLQREQSRRNAQKLEAQYRETARKEHLAESRAAR